MTLSAEDWRNAFVISCLTVDIPLPTEIGREELVKIILKNEKLSEDFDIKYIVKHTDGYSGADISGLCREAAYMPMRRKLKEQGGFRNI